MLQLLNWFKHGGGGERRISSSLQSIPVCTASHPCPPYPLRSTRLLSHPTCVTPSPAPFLQRDLPAPGSQDTSLLHTHTAKPLSTCNGSRSKKRGVTKAVPLCRSGHCPLLQSRTHSQEVTEEETGCLHMHLVPSKSELVALV